MMRRRPPLLWKQRGVLSALQPGTWASHGGVSPGDPFFANVVNLSHFIGSNGSTTFTDSSSHATNLTTASGSPSISTAQFKFGSSSYFNGGSTGAIENNQAYYAVGTGPFTIEFFVYPTTISALQYLAYWGDGISNGIYIDASGFLNFYAGGSLIITGGTALTVNAWNYCAAVRSGTGANQAELFLAAVSQGTGTDAGNHSSSSLYCGGSANVSNALQGYMAEFRATVGTARTISSVPTAPFPNHS